MKIQVPSEEEFLQKKRKKRISGIFGFIFGIFLFGMAGMRIFRYGFSQVEIYTWIALGSGVLSFGYLAYKFGNEFWSTLFRS